MGQVLHANARTTEAIRREIRHNKESIAKAAVRLNVNPKTIIKWRKREDTKDLAHGPSKDPIDCPFRSGRGSPS